MSHRQVTKGDILHVYNRGVDKRNVFLSEKDYNRFIERIRFCRLYDYPYSKFLKLKTTRTLDESNLILETNYLYDNPLCTIHAFVLMKNHFHLILEESVTNGISKFIQKLINGYTKYFNTKYERSGHLFQSTYKHVFVDTEEQFIHLSKYIHTNPATANFVTRSELHKYKWSSYPSYIFNHENNFEADFIHRKYLSSLFKSPAAYANFIQQDDFIESLFILQELSVDIEDTF